MLQSALDDWIDARWRDGTFHTDDGLQHSQRRALALLDLCCHDLPHEPDDTGPDGPEADAPDEPGSGAAPSAHTRHRQPRPSISLLLDAKTLAGQPIDGLEDLLSRRCELTNGTPIPLAAAQRLLCGATVHQFLTRIDEHGTIETLGITDLQRDATRRQRQALRLRDGGCVFPGCHVPFERCQIHHLTPYELDGPTLLVNLVPLCHHHHHLVHEGRWRLWRTTDGQLHLVKPDRTYVPVVGHGHHPRPEQPPGTGPPPPPPLPVHHRRTSHRAPPSSGPAPPG